MIRRFAAILLVVFAATAVTAQSELRFCLRGEPKTFDPALVQDENSEAIRYLTGGVLIRVNRLTQQLQPELATSWKLLNAGRTIQFKLRPGVKFSDGTPFTAADVKFTMEHLMDPAVNSTTGEAFRSGKGALQFAIKNDQDISITFPAPVAGLDRLFDQVAVQSAKSPKATSGPYMVAEHKSGSYILLKRNPNYWKRDAAGKQLPYIDSVRLEIQSNRDLEFMRFSKGELHLINTLDPDYFDRLAAGGTAHDAGPSLDVEQMWFNQVAKSPLPDYKKAWFQSAAFRRAVSMAINRDDLARVAYAGHARAAMGPISPANRVWFNAKLKPIAVDLSAAKQLLAKDGFQLKGDRLFDKQGKPVEFSIITNAGNKGRERMATMIQEDLAKIGIKINVVTLDFPSLIERITRTYDYEACILGLVNVEPDPNTQMNVWMSSSEMHPWNPAQAKPATTWEAEIDRLMQQVASSGDFKTRKAAFDRVQEIVSEQAPILYLINKNALSAASKNLKGVQPSVLRPQVYWNAEMLELSGGGAGR